jgi:hypothetical protein
VITAGRLHRGLTAAAILLAVARPAFAQEPAPPRPGILAEPPALARVDAIVERRAAARDRDPSDGFFVDFGGYMITGSGWIAAGPGYRQHLFGGRAIFTSSAVLSWRLYSAVSARVEVPGLMRGHASAGAQALYEDALQVNYFGLGNHSDKKARSGYQFRGTDFSAYGEWKNGRAVAIRARAGWLGYADVSRMAGRGTGYPDTQDLFTAATAPGLQQQPDFLHADVSVEADMRDQIADPSRGAFYRAAAARYADRDSGRFSFSAFELEAARYVTIVPDKVVLAAHAWTAMTAAGKGHDVPFYLMPSLGGKNTLRGFADFRFADRDMETLSVEARVRLYAHIDVAGFVDTGKVAPRVRDLGFSDLHSNAGFGLRFRTRNVTIARLDVGTGVEGWHLVFKLDEPFRRKKPSGGFTTVAPFVP